jgi:hypothetical protein
MDNSLTQVEGLLSAEFKQAHIKAALRHFQLMIDDYVKRDWEDSAAKGGKFIEAVLKALWVRAGEAVPAGRHFKAGTIMDQLQNKTAAPDQVRITIPRACRFAYEIASNRGARHDADEIDANEMDATVVLSTCAWIISEMVRLAQKGMDLSAATEAVASLMRRRYPFFDEIDGRVYVDIGKSAPDVALLMLWYRYPCRVNRRELIEWLMRHQFSNANAGVAVKRIAGYVDDESGNLRLRNSGLVRAEQLISDAGGKAWTRKH